MFEHSQGCTDNSEMTAHVNSDDTKYPTLTPFPHNTDSNAFSTNAGLSVIQCLPNNPATSRLGLHTCSSIELHTSGELHMEKKRLAAVFPFPPLSLPCVVLHHISPTFFIGITLVRRPTPLLQLLMLLSSIKHMPTQSTPP